MAIEQEIKLAFPDIEAARLAVQTAGGRLDVSRRLLDDQLFDTADDTLRATGRTLRVRRDGTTGILTVKGPARPGPVKSREEIEVQVTDAVAVEAQLRLLGFVPRLRMQKYREEYTLEETRLAIDETPIGTFVEIEGGVAAIDRVAAALGRSRADYVLDSYSRLFDTWCRKAGIEGGDMTFEIGGFGI